MFSLCIPTMDRFDTFLHQNIEKYLTNELISEIIIVDENGNDYEKLSNSYKTNSKIKLYKNDNVLGPFMNKRRCCSLATNDWIALIDSDNFADHVYFETAKQYIDTHKLSNGSILSPCFAKPNFDYSKITPNVITSSLIKSMINQPWFFTMLNTGNYVIHRDLINGLNIDHETEKIKQSSSCDVIYMNTLLFEQCNVSFHIVPGLEYDHVVHNGSVYMTTCRKHKVFNEYVHDRCRRLH
jgi:hypothetical protein